MVFCIIIGCSNRSERDVGTYCRIPTVREREGSQERERTEERRRLWLKAISRADLTEGKLQHQRVCWKHFVTGRAAAPWDINSIDWVPTLHLGHDKFDSSLAAKKRTDRAQRLKSRRKLIFESSAAQSVTDLQNQTWSDIADPATDQVQHGQSASDNNVTVQTDLTAEQISGMQSTVQKYYTDLYSQWKQPPQPNFFDISNFVNDDNKVKYYTGLPNFNVLRTVFEFVHDHVKCGKSLTQFQEFVMVLAKLRLNLGLHDLAYRAEVSLSTVSRILYKWIVALDIRLAPACMIWPEREDLRKSMPLCFKQSFGSKVVVIIDCFEIFVDRPSNLLARTETWSQYKHHNTVKFLIGVTPQGTVSFLSRGWGGRVSDKRLTENSGILNRLLPGDVVLADRGFTIDESVSMMGAVLRMPAFTRGRDQLTALEVEESRAVSNVRIHVERVIGCVRQKYMILGGPLPIDFIARKPNDDQPLIDRMTRVCCCLNNLCDSVVPFS